MTFRALLAVLLVACLPWASAHAQDGKYPISRFLYFYTAGEPEAASLGDLLAERDPARQELRLGEERPLGEAVARHELVGGLRIAVGDKPCDREPIASNHARQSRRTSLGCKPGAESAS